jgi:hypothetical protein
LATASIWALAASTSASTFGAVAAGRVGLCFIGAVITAFASTFTIACFASTAACFATALTTAAVVASSAFATSPIAALA